MADDVRLGFDAGHGVRGVLVLPRETVVAALASRGEAADRALAKLDDPLRAKRPLPRQVQDTIDAAEAVLAIAATLAALKAGGP